MRRRESRIHSPIKENFHESRHRDPAAFHAGTFEKPQFITKV
jgi:hypothetical protein